MWVLHEYHPKRCGNAARRICVFALTLAGSLSAVAAERLLGDSSLGRWVEQSEDVKQLSDALASHPIFRGETIQLVSLERGRLTHLSNRLNKAIQNELKQVLLSLDVRIARVAPVDPCGLPRDIKYRLGVEIERDGREHRVNLTIVDVDEEEWVKSITWAGRLSRAERKASELAVNTSPEGSLGNPLPLADDAAVVAALSKGMTCRLPKPLDGPLHVRSPDNRLLTQIANGVKYALKLSALVDLTHDAGAADWLVSVDLHDAGVETGQVLVQLHAADDPARTRTLPLASVFVDKAPGSAPQAGVLGPITDSDGGMCRDGGEPQRCTRSINFELYKPAHTLLFVTSEGGIKWANCDDSSTRHQPGPQRYEWTIPRRVDVRVGIYALAVPDLTVAQQLQSVLNRAPGVCERDGNMNAWLDQLDAVLTRHGDHIHWQAHHLVYTSSGIVTL